jgi:hypothetical protein
VSFVDRLAGVAPLEPSRYLPFRVDGRDVGLVDKDFADRLRALPPFRVGDRAVDLDGRLAGPDERTRAVDEALRRLKAEGLVPGWRDEHYPVAAAFSAPTLFTMERAAVPLFGVKAYGVHMNGFVRDGDGLKMWIGRRSLKKPTGPGKLDQLVAGGQPAGISLRANLVKECWEEASIPEALARRALPVGGVSYRTRRSEGVRDDVLFAYDLELPADFRPANADGEIEAFYLWPIERVTAAVRDTDEFKFNCALVVIDFLIRHGCIEPDHPEYVELLTGLRR